MPSRARHCALAAALIPAACAGGGEGEWVYPASPYPAGQGGYAQPGASQPQYSEESYRQPPLPQDGYGAPGASYPQPGGYPEPAPAAPGRPPPSAGPQGSSQRGPSDDRYDEVGYAQVRGLASNGPGAAAQVVAISPELATGSFAEVTSLDSGRTILVLVTGQSPIGGLIALSPAAAQQLGIADAAPVRVRRVDPPVADQAALRAGRAAPARVDAPPPLLAGLRKMLPAAPGGAAPGYAPPAANAPAPPARGRFYVQVAALSSASRARSLADSLTRGIVRTSGSLYRVQMGPFATAAEAERARAEAVRRGFRDARILD